MKTISAIITTAMFAIVLAGCGEHNKGPDQQFTPPSVNASQQQSRQADFIPVEKEPIIIKKVEPVYPELAKKAGLEGKVWVKVWVDTDGCAKQVDILKSDSDVFNQACIDAAKQFLFTPAYFRNKPVGVWVSVPFKFKLADKSDKAGREEISFMQGYLAAKEDAVTKMEEEAASAQQSGKPVAELKQKIQQAKAEIQTLKEALRAMRETK